MLMICCGAWNYEFFFSLDMIISFLLKDVFKYLKEKYFKRNFFVSLE